MVHWPGDPPVHVERVQQIEHGDMATVSRLSLGAHTGTHMDAPVHFLQGERGIDAMPLDATVGPARVIPIDNERAVTAAELDAWDIQEGERLLLKTRNSERVWETDRFVEDFVYISKEAAAALAARRIRCVGIDYLSVGGYEVDIVETHRALLEAGIWIIEGLDLSRVEPGEYDLICLPLKILGGDGAPARAALRPRSG